MIRALHALKARAADRRGVAAVEFALVAPVLLLMLIGIFDMGHMAYVWSVLHGAVQQVGRNGTLEDTSTTQIDAYVRQIVQGVAPGATVDTKRSSYYDFSDIARPEVWNDKNGDGTCNNSETYSDENRNGRWDADIGKDGNGGANDVVVYTVTVTYSPLFAIPLLGTVGTTRTLTAKAVVKNQPYALQSTYGSVAGQCT